MYCHQRQLDDAEEKKGNRTRRTKRVRFELREWPDGKSFMDQEKIVTDIFGLIAEALEKEHNRRGR